MVLSMPLVAALLGVFTHPGAWAANLLAGGFAVVLCGLGIVAVQLEETRITTPGWLMAAFGAAPIVLGTAGWLAGMGSTTVGVLFGAPLALLGAIAVFVALTLWFVDDVVSIDTESGWVRHESQVLWIRNVEEHPLEAYDRVQLVRASDDVFRVELAGAEEPCWLFGGDPDQARHWARVVARHTGLPIGMVQGVSHEPSDHER